jgi:peptide/nickel transport system substrate-binding protein
VLFAQPQVRQAIAMCIDRQKLASELMAGQSSILDAYLPVWHSQHASDLPQYSYDPQAAANLLQNAGWLDADGDGSTPRTALGVPGVSDGTPFEFTYLVSADAERQAAAQMIQTMLAGCGLKANLDFQEPAVYLAEGPTGPVFGRDFDMAQFALPVLSMPACQLFTSQEIPGPYPTFPKGWGGMNVAGYRNPAYDQACQSALTSIPGTDSYQQAYSQSQLIFAQELPVLPLYTRFKVVVSRPELCFFTLEQAYHEPFWNLENLDKGDHCRP